MLYINRFYIKRETMKSINITKSSIEERTVYQYITLPVSAKYTVIAHDIVDGTIITVYIIFSGNFYLISGCTTIMTVFGLFMVISWRRKKLLFILNNNGIHVK